MLEILNSKVKGKIIQFLLHQQDKILTVSDIARLTKTSKSRTSEVLRGFEQAELVHRKNIGKSAIYQLVQNNPQVQSFISLLNNEHTPLEQLLKSCLAAAQQFFGKKLKTLLLFGSQARGTATTHSDVDIFIVAEHLPKNIKQRMRLMDDFELYALENYQMRVMPIFYEPKDLDTEFMNPLIYGILTGYRILYDDGFWKYYIQKIKPAIIKLDPIYYEGDQPWRIKELIAN